MYVHDFIVSVYTILLSHQTICIRKDDLIARFKESSSDGCHRSDLDLRTFIILRADLCQSCFIFLFFFVHIIGVVIPVNFGAGHNDSFGFLAIGLTRIWTKRNVSLKRSGVKVFSWNLKSDIQRNPVRYISPVISKVFATI